MQPNTPSLAPVRRSASYGVQAPAREGGSFGGQAMVGYLGLNEPRTDLFHGLFALHGTGRLSRHTEAPREVPDPNTGRPLRVATVELSDRAVCPACTQLGTGGYVSFESDLRLAFACPSCRKLVWIAGA
jgi:hypothetical protein